MSLRDYVKRYAFILVEFEGVTWLRKREGRLTA